MIIRFDDICPNTRLNDATVMARHAMELGHDVWWCISPLAHKAAEGQRVFPRMFKAYSDPRVFYRPDICGVVATPHTDIKRCSHGLIHIDHRLMTAAAQELSILASCALVGSKTFVPPFNKWNGDTETICKKNGIELVKFEDGWLSMDHNHWREDHEKWYCHHRHFTTGQWRAWFPDPKNTTTTIYTGEGSVVGVTS